MDAALSIPELVESILVHLDTRTLLTSAQRTNRTWHGLIQTSPSLQKALFLQPDESIRSPVFNDLLVETFPFCFQQLLHQDAGSTLQPISRSKDTATLNAQSFPASTHITSKGKAFARHDASWRKMLIQQPPLRSYGVVMTACVPPPPSPPGQDTVRGGGGGGGSGGEEDQDEGEEAATAPDDVSSRALQPTMGGGAGVHEILLMPSPTLASSRRNRQQQQQHDDEEEEEEAAAAITMPFLLEKCLTAPQQPARDDQHVPISGFRIIWNNDTATEEHDMDSAHDNRDTSQNSAAGVAVNDESQPSEIETLTAATFPGDQGKQIRSAVVAQARQHRMVLNAVVGLMKLGPGDAEMQRVREILLGGNEKEEDESGAGCVSDNRTTKAGRVVKEDVLCGGTAPWERDVCSDVEI